MKKIWPLSLLGIGLCSLFLLTACQQTPEQSDEISFKGKEIHKLDLFTPESTGQDDEEYGYDQGGKAVIEGKFQAPYTTHHGQKSFVFPKELSLEEKAHRLQEMLEKKQWEPGGYELPLLKENESREEVNINGIVLDDFPFKIKKTDNLSKQLSFINLERKELEDHFLITGKKDLDKEAFLFFDKDSEIHRLRLKPLEQEIQYSSMEGQRRPPRTLFFYHQDNNLVEIFTGGNLFQQARIHYPLGKKVINLMQKSFQASWEAINFDSPSQKTNQRASTAQLIVPQKEYHVEFLPRYPGAKIKEVKLIQRKEKTDTGAQESTSLQARLQGKTLLSSELSFLQNIPKEQDPKRILSQALGKAGEKVSEPQYFYQELPSALATEQSLIHFSVPTTGEYQLFAVDNNNNVHSLAFKTQLQTKNMRLTAYSEELKLQIVEDAFLTGAGLSGQLDQILGKGNYRLELPQSDRYDQDHGQILQESKALETERALIMKLNKDTKKHKVQRLIPGGQTINIHFFTHPNQHATGTLEVLDINGTTYHYNLDFFMPKLPEAKISRDLFSQKFNVLPSEGHRAHTIKVWSKNTKELTIYTQTCTLVNTGDFSQAKRQSLLPARKAQDEDAHDSRSTLAELHFFDCWGKIESHHLPVKHFAYWKRIDQERELPENLKKSPYFRLSFDKSMKDAKYYMRSPVGLFAKVAPHQELLIWALSYAKGRLVKEGKIQIFDDQGKLLKDLDIKETPLRFPLKNLQTDYLLLRYHHEEKQAESFLVTTLDGKKFFGEKNAKSASWLLPKQTAQQENWYNEFPHTIKVYGYSDRYLYRPGDTVHFAGFVHDLGSKETKNNAVQTGFIVVEMQNYADEDSKKLIISQLDAFGGFTGSFQLNEYSRLGGFDLKFIYTQDPQKTWIEDFNQDRKARENYKKKHPIASYWTEILVDEFQKSSFHPQVKKAVKGGQLYLELSPKYYTGEPLKNYDLNLEYSLSEKESCEDCRWKEKSDFYYNYVEHRYFHYGGSYQKTDLSWGTLLFQLGDLSQLGYKGTPLTLKITTQIKDKLTDEVKTAIDYLDLPPEVKIGLDGFAYDWLDEERLSSYQINAHLENPKKVKTLSYERYFRPFNFEQELDNEGTYYYHQGSEMKLVNSWTLTPKTHFTLPLIFKEYQGGEYFLKLITKNDQGLVNGEVHKNIYYYDPQIEKGFQGDMENNYRLHVHIPREEYRPGKKIPISISPYIKGAQVLITAERGDQILETQSHILDGKPLSITAKESFYPNVQISVSQFVGEEIQQQLWGTGVQKRKEPAFFAGYAEALIQEDLKRINIKLSTDKEHYQPGEKVKVKILTTDHQGKPVTARVSLSIVDKALIDLYDLIKAPLPYFYNRVGSSIGNFGNWKNLYYALRTFFAEGEKGGGGSDGSIKNLRKKFYDLAFRDAAIITSGGKAEIGFILPDNLTTWMLDAIAVSQDSKLGTQRESFKVSQALILEANLPHFLTLGDEIILPVWLIAHDPQIKADTEAILQGKIKDHEGKVLKSFQQKGKSNQKFWIPIKVDDQLLEAPFVMIEAEVVLGKFKDAIERKIPIRTEGILSKRFIFHHGQKGKEKFIFEDLAKKGKLKVSLSRFPKSVLSEPIRYLLDFSPLASSDSIIRTAQTSLEVKRLTEKGLLTGEYYQEGKIKLFNGERKSVGSLLENSLSELGRRQSRNGSISNYPVREMYYENAENDPRTEIALLGLLESMEAEGFRQLIPSHFREKLEKYLNTLGNDTPELYLYMLAQRKTNKKLNLTLVRQLAKQYPKNITVQTLSFYLLARENTPNTLRKSAEQLGILFDQAFLQGQYFEELLIDLKALQGYYLKGLIAQSQYKSNAQSFFSEELNKQLLSLLKSRRNDGLRSRSSTTNFLILDALNQALEGYYSDPVHFKQGEKTMECEIQFGTEKHKLLDTTKQQLILPFTQRKELELERSCNQAGFIDLQAEYLLQDLNKKENELHHLEYFSLSLPKEIEKDKKVTFKGSFKPQKESKNLIVEFNIPSQFKLLANQAPRDHHDQLFGLLDDWECFPDHHEFRFDRVILEYKHLKAGQNCSFEFDALPNFEGKSVLPPSKLYEQDRTEVWGSSKLTIIE